MKPKVIGAGYLLPVTNLDSPSQQQLDYLHLD